MFDYCGLRNIQVTPNTQFYPAGDFNAAFTRLYMEKISKDIFYMYTMLGNGNIIRSDFLDLYPRLVINVSHCIDKHERVDCRNVDQD